MDSRTKQRAVIALFGLVTLAGPLGADSKFYGPPSPRPKYQAFTDVESRGTRKINEALRDLTDLVKDLDAKGDLCVGSEGTPRYIPIASLVGFVAERAIDRPQAWTGYGDPSAGDTLTYLMLQSAQPSVTGIGNPWVAHTKAPLIDHPSLPLKISREHALAIKIEQSSGSLSPKDVLQMALEVNHGDYQSAALTVHNLLKEIAYGSRQSAEDGSYKLLTMTSGANRPMSEFMDLQRNLKQSHSSITARYTGEGEIHLGIPKTDTTLEDKLANLRVTDDKFVKDKLGPWYHMFGLLFFSTQAMGGAQGAGFEGWVENLLRNYAPRALFSSPPDHAKQQVNLSTPKWSEEIIDLLHWCPDDEDPSGGYVTHEVTQKDWYCTNRPHIDVGCHLPNTLQRGNLPEPGTAEFDQVTRDLLDNMKKNGLDTTPFGEFAIALQTRINAIRNPEDIPPFLRSVLPQGPIPADGPGLAAWRADMRKRAQSWWVNVLADGDGHRMLHGLKNVAASDSHLRDPALRSVEALEAMQRERLEQWEAARAKEQEAARQTEARRVAHAWVHGPPPAFNPHRPIDWK